MIRTLLFTLVLVLKYASCQSNITYPSWLEACVDAKEWTVLNCSHPQTPPSFSWQSPLIEEEDTPKLPLSISNCFVIDCPFINFDSLNLALENVYWKTSIESQENVKFNTAALPLTHHSISNTENLKKDIFQVKRYRK
jgi:hypothetical protein